MNKVAIVCDTIASLPQELIQEYDIRLVPLHIIFRGKDYRDRVDITPSDIYKLMRGSKELPTSSGPTPEEFLEAFQEASRKASGLACILVSSALSPMTHNSAAHAKEMFTQRLPNFPIEIIDSRTVAGAFELIVLSAA